MEIPDVGAVGSFVQWTKQDKTVKKKKPKAKRNYRYVLG